MPETFGRIKVYGDSKMNGKLVVKKKLKAKGTLSVGGSTTISGRVKSKGNIQCNGQLDVYGESILEGETTINGELTVTGSSNINGNATINNLTVSELTTPNLVFTSPVNVIDSDETISSADSGTVYSIDTSGSSVTVTLPSAQLGIIYTFIAVAIGNAFTVDLGSGNSAIGVSCYEETFPTSTSQIVSLSFSSSLNCVTPQIGDKYEIIAISNSQWHFKCATINALS